MKTRAREPRWTWRPSPNIELQRALSPHGEPKVEKFGERGEEPIRPTVVVETGFLAL